MSEARCPHCQTVLPEKATFCAACGNRIEGWSQVPVTDAPEKLPGGEEPTTNMQPTPSLLRVAALSKKGKGTDDKRPAESDSAKSESDSSMMRSVKRPPFPLWALLGGVALLCAGLAYYLASRKPAPVPVTAAPAPSPAVVSAAPMAPPPTVPSKKKVRAHRIEPLQVATKGSKSAGGGLPHKTVATDSKPKAAPKIDPNATQAALGDAPEEATPLTEEEMKAQAEASIDADGVRFVVKSHLSQVHACYERSFKESSPGGRVEIGFAIGSDGNAKRVRTESNTTGSDPLATCLEARVKSWQFPRPVGGDYELIYPFVFAPGS